MNTGTTINNNELDDYLSRLDLYANAMERNSIGHLEPSCTIRAHVVRRFVQVIRANPLSPRHAVEVSLKDMIGHVKFLDVGGVITDEWRRLMGRQLMHEAGNVIEILNKNMQAEKAQVASSRNTIFSRNRVKAMLTEGYSQIDIARLLGVSKTRIFEACSSITDRKGSERNEPIAEQIEKSKIRDRLKTAKRHAANKISINQRRRELYAKRKSGSSGVRSWVRRRDSK